MPFDPFSWRTTHRVKNRSDSRYSSGFLAPTKAAVFLVEMCNLVAINNVLRDFTIHCETILDVNYVIDRPDCLFKIFV